MGCAAMTERKVAVVTEEVRAGLRRATALSVEEETVLRLRHGVSPEPHAPLARVAPVDSVLGDELLVLELQLLRAVRARAAQAAAASGTADPSTKSKIVRALRKKR
jgi:hypothetical protein